MFTTINGLLFYHIFLICICTWIQSKDVSSPAINEYLIREPLHSGFSSIDILNTPIWKNLTKQEIKRDQSNSKSNLHSKIPSSSRTKRNDSKQSEKTQLKQDLYKRQLYNSYEGTTMNKMMLDDLTTKIWKGVASYEIQTSWIHPFCLRSVKVIPELEAAWNKCQNMGIDWGCVYTEMAGGDMGLSLVRVGNIFSSVTDNDLKNRLLCGLDKCRDAWKVYKMEEKNHIIYNEVQNEMTNRMWSDYSANKHVVYMPGIRYKNVNSTGNTNGTNCNQNGGVNGNTNGGSNCNTNGGSNCNTNGGSNCNTNGGSNCNTNGGSNCNTNGGINCNTNGGLNGNKNWYSIVHNDSNTIFSTSNCNRNGGSNGNTNGGSNGNKTYCVNLNTNTIFSNGSDNSTGNGNNDTHGNTNNDYNGNRNGGSMNGNSNVFRLGSSNSNTNGGSNGYNYGCPNCNTNSGPNGNKMGNSSGNTYGGTHFNVNDGASGKNSYGGNTNNINRYGGVNGNMNGGSNGNMNGGINVYRSGAPNSNINSGSNGNKIGSSSVNTYAGSHYNINDAFHSKTNYSSYGNRNGGFSSSSSGGPIGNMNDGGYVYKYGGSNGGSSDNISGGFSGNANGGSSDNISGGGQRGNNNSGFNLNTNSGSGGNRNVSSIAYINDVSNSNRNFSSNTNDGLNSNKYNGSYYTTIDGYNNNRNHYPNGELIVSNSNSKVTLKSIMKSGMNDKTNSGSSINGKNTGKYRSIDYQNMDESSALNEDNANKHEINGTAGEQRYLRQIDDWISGHNNNIHNPTISEFNNSTTMPSMSHQQINPENKIKDVLTEGGIQVPVCCQSKTQTQGCETTDDSKEHDILVDKDLDMEERVELELMARVGACIREEVIKACEPKIIEELAKLM